MHGANVKLLVPLEQCGQGKMIAAINAFLMNPDVGLATEFVKLTQEIALVVTGANPPSVELGELQGSGHVDWGVVRELA